MSLATPNGLNGQKETELGYASVWPVRCDACLPTSHWWLTTQISDQCRTEMELQSRTRWAGMASTPSAGSRQSYQLGHGDRSPFESWCLALMGGVEWLLFMWSHLFLSLLSMTFYGFRAFVCFCTHGSSTHRSWDELLLATSTPFGS